MSEMSPEELVKGFIKFFQEELIVLNQDLDRLGAEPEGAEKLTVAMLSAALNLARIANWQERIPRFSPLNLHVCPALLTPEERQAFAEARK